jgi:hypothetical protein
MGEAPIPDVNVYSLIRSFPRKRGSIYKKKARFPLARERAIAFFDFTGISGKNLCLC